MNDREHKDQGNKLFLAHRYDEAISCYTKAIVILACVQRSVTIRRNNFSFLIVLTAKKRLCAPVLYQQGSVFSQTESLG